MRKQSIKDLQFWERYRPTLLEKGKGIPIILLPRIRRLVGDGKIHMNFMFYGSGGLGKTSLANILTEDTDFLKLKATERGVNTLEIIEDHCRSFSIPLKKKNQKGNPHGQPVIWLEEFDKTTPQFRQSLRDFMEDDLYKDIRFIATANNIAKLERTKEDEALMSRFTKVDFDPQTLEEKEYLKVEQKRYLSAVVKNVSKSQEFDLSSEIIESVIDTCFPNLRLGIQQIQEIVISGSHQKFLAQNNDLNKNVYEYILDGSNIFSKNFYYVTENYPRDKTEDLLRLMSRPFFQFLLDEHPEIIKANGFKLLKLSKEYNEGYVATIDPEMHLVSYISNIKELLNQE